LGEAIKRYDPIRASLKPCSDLNSSLEAISDFGAISSHFLQEVRQKKIRAIDKNFFITVVSVFEEV
jgi:hypothetical protein